MIFMKTVQQLEIWTCGSSALCFVTMARMYKSVSGSPAITGRIITFAVMAFRSIAVTLPPTEAVRLGLDHQRASPQSSISSVQFAIPSDCTSLSAFEEDTSSYRTTSTLKSPITSNGDNSIALDSSYTSSVPNIARRYRHGSKKASFESVFESPSVHEDDTLSVNTISTSSSILRRSPYLDIRIRRSKSELMELAVAHTQAIAMYKDRSQAEAQKIICPICDAAGRRFILKNIRELTLHLRIHNMPKHTHCMPIRCSILHICLIKISHPIVVRAAGVRRVFVKASCCGNGSALDN
ncbi:hypothetical protein PILCRDRAFT_533027 [Piloderma croceum F 1598]|uniref:Uncharacterized protein n=1 Tax=Piloderma croceum (strain F 1598) TaxID=765440 RepID=A0A0C3B2I7_PILCF|nr:hypothetical protein PILCRDRAFT_533027 [Piloderma croceum F 1598]